MTLRDVRFDRELKLRNAPGTPCVLQELAEARMFVVGNGDRGVLHAAILPPFARHGYYLSGN